MELKRRRRAPARSLLSGSREAAGSRSRRSPTGRRGRVLPRVKASAQRTIVRWGCRRGSSGRAGLRLVAGTAGSAGRGSLQTAVYKRRVAVYKRGSLQTCQFAGVAVYKRGSLQTARGSLQTWQFTNVAVYKRRVAVVNTTKVQRAGGPAGTTTILS